MGIAAATLYIASVQTGHRRTQKEVSEVCGVTEVTIRNRYKEIVKSLTAFGTLINIFLHLSSKGTVIAFNVAAGI